MLCTKDTNKELIHVFIPTLFCYFKQISAKRNPKIYVCLVSGVDERILLLFFPLSYSFLLFTIADLFEDTPSTTVSGTFGLEMYKKKPGITTLFYQVHCAFSPAGYSSLTFSGNILSLVDAFFRDQLRLQHKFKIFHSFTEFETQIIPVFTDLLHDVYIVCRRRKSKAFESRKKA